MKKVLALVLAVMMMATVAFAATTPDATNPFGGTDGSDPKSYVPGSELEITDSGIVNNLDLGASVIAGDVKAVNSTNYALGKTQWEQGKTLVESVKFDDVNDKLIIKLKQDYTMVTEKELKGTIELRGKRVGKTKIKDVTLKIDTTVGYTLADGKTTAGGNINPFIKIDGNNDATVDAGSYTGIYFDTDATDGTKAKNFLWKVVDKGAKYGTLEFDAADGDTNIEVRVYDGDKLYLYNNVNANTSVLKAYADVDAELRFLNFPGAPTFNSTATVRFYEPEDSYIYGMKDGKLTNINAKWDDDEGCFILKTRTLGGYVFSDKKLNVAAADASTNNPDTGANDVVGIAGALAAVALVSAAAVSLKK